MTSDAISPFLERLYSCCPQIDILLNLPDKAPYEQGTRYGAGLAAAVVRPSNTAQVQAIVSTARELGVRVIVQGANTGLVAAGTPDITGSQVVLSTTKLKGVIEVDRDNQSVKVMAGTLLSELNTRLKEDGLFFPIDLGADPSIGGMIAANTGGARLLKYGDVRQNLLGVEVVLAEPAGVAVDLNRALRKNNVGFDFKQLFVGTGGALGIVTSATLRLHSLPGQCATALLVPRDDDALQPLLRALYSEFADFLTSCEGISRDASDAVCAHIAGIENPFDSVPGADYAVLVELTATRPASSGLNLEEMLLEFLEREFGNTVGNAIIGKGENLWRLRHSITDAIRAHGKVIAMDLSVPRSRFAEFRIAAKAHIAQHYPWLRICDFGHLGDGGVHFNMVWPTTASRAYDEQVVDTLRREMYNLAVHTFCGSFSAEHGVGPYNVAFYREFTPRPVLIHTGAIQCELDPGEILGSTWYGPSK